MSVARKGFHTITPRIVAVDAAGLVAFLRDVFGAEGQFHTERPSEITVGDSMLMITPAGEREPFAAFLYVYVSDVEATYRKALAAGALSLEGPQDTPYGDRRAMIRDPFGNVWQLACVLRP